jgi:hypothetical protein
MPVHHATGRDRSSAQFRAERTRKGPACRAFCRWRDPDSNRGHHDFQSWTRVSLTAANTLQTHCFATAVFDRVMFANCVLFVAGLGSGTVLDAQCSPRGTGAAGRWEPLPTCCDSGLAARGGVARLLSRALPTQATRRSGRFRTTAPDRLERRRDGERSRSPAGSAASLPCACVGLTSSWLDRST